MKRTPRSMVAVIAIVISFLTGCKAGYNVTKAVQDKPIVVLYDNDVHCSVGGYATIAGLRDDLKANSTPYVALVSSGDFVQGGSLGAISKGSYIIDIMNSVGYDVVTLGNHEFDYGIPRLLELTKSLTAEISDCNLYDLRTGKLMFKPYRMMNFGSVDVAFIGVSTPYSFVSAAPSYFKDENGNFIYSLCTETFYDTVQKTVDDARAAGAEYVVALTHLGDDAEANEINALELAARTSGFDAILDGHAHSIIPSLMLKNKDGKEVVVTSTGSNFQNIGKMTISTDGKISTELISTDVYVNQNKDVLAAIDKVKKEYNKLGSRVIGRSESAMSPDEPQLKRAVRFKEMGLGDFCADAVRGRMHTDIAFMGGGSVRNALPEGDITFNDIFTVFPFGNTIATGSITGKQILDVLEFSVYVLPIEFGGFLQVSGLKFDVDTSIPSPVKVDAGMVFTEITDGPRRVSNVMFEKAPGEYEPIDLERTYSVSGTSFLLLEHGDGFGDVLNIPTNDTGMIDLQLLQDYIVEDLGGVIPAKYAVPQGRINMKN